MIYIAIFVVLIALRGSPHSRTTNDLYYTATLLFLTVFAGFRFAVGCDWRSYRRHFEEYPTFTFLENAETREPFYRILVLAIDAIGLPYLWLNVVAAIVFFYGLHRFASTQPDRLGTVILTFPVLIVGMPMSAVRQAIAIGFVMMAYRAFVRRSVVGYVVLVVVAALFHNSALLFLVLAPLIGARTVRSRIVLMAVLAVPAAYGLVSSGLTEIATERYVESDVDAAGAVFRISTLIASALLFLLVLRKPWAENYPREYLLYFVGAWMMVGTLFLLPLSSVIADRIGYYLVPLQAAIFARIAYLNINARAFFVIAPYIGLGALFVVWTNLSGNFQGCYMPYQTWLFGVPTTFY